LAKVLRNEESGEEQLRGQFSERCPWFTFSPVILADFLAGDNTLALLARLDRYIDRLELQTGLKAHRGMITRWALELFLEMHDIG
jgi:hypothetical protein